MTGTRKNGDPPTVTPADLKAEKVGQSRLSAWRDVAVVFIAFALTASLGLMLWLSVRINDLSQHSDDCVTPGQACYEQTRAQAKTDTAAIIGATNAFTLAVVYCANRHAPGVQTLTQIKDCAARILHPH